MVPESAAALGLLLALLTATTHATTFAGFFSCPNKATDPSVNTASGLSLVSSQLTCMASFLQCIWGLKAGAIEDALHKSPMLRSHCK